LSDVTDDPNECLLTVAGENVGCSFRSPNYVCLPDTVCQPEWNILQAMIPGSTCPASTYVVPTERSVKAPTGAPIGLPPSPTIQKQMMKMGGMKNMR
jgi:hypothetical protein